MEFKKIGVLGAGQMGAGIAQVAASKGMQVIIRDIDMKYCDKGIAGIKKGLDKRVAKGKMEQAAVDAIMANISGTVDLKDLADCDVVIEAIIEDPAIKIATFKELGEICREDAILATNTSSISIGVVASECKNPERCVGMHFFFPVTAMKLVEIIRSAKTSDATVAAVKELSAAMGKTAVECLTDTPGFIVNRCLFALLLEAVHCYEDGVASIEDIDTALKLGLNHPMGPFEMMDMSGMDTFPHVCETLEALPITTWATPEAAKKLVAEGRYGKKNGHGWYDYE